jgi:hypothetical protein
VVINDETDLPGNRPDHPFQTQLSSKIEIKPHPLSSIENGLLCSRKAECFATIVPLRVFEMTVVRLCSGEVRVER